MDLQNFDNVKLRHLQVFENVVETDESLQLAVCMGVFGEEIMKENNLTKKSPKLKELLKKCLKEKFIQPENSIINESNEVEEEIRSCQGKYDAKAFDRKNRAAQKMYEEFLAKEYRKFEDDPPEEADRLRNARILAGKTAKHKFQFSLEELQHVDKRDYNSDYVEDIMCSGLTLSQFSFLLLNSSALDFSCSVVSTFGSELYPVIMNVGQNFDKRKPRKSKHLNIFRCTVTFDMLKKSEAKNPVEDALVKNEINKNVAKEEIYRKLCLSETNEKEEERTRILETFGKRLPYALERKKNFKAWKEDLVKREVQATKELYFFITNFRLFASDPNGNHRRRFYCEHCFRTFYQITQVSKEHIENCRGPTGEVVREKMPEPGSHLMFQRPKNKERSPLTLFAVSASFMIAVSVCFILSICFSRTLKVYC